MAEAPIMEILDFESIGEIVNDHYDLGELTSAVRIFNGYVNVTNDIHVLKSGRISNYILRIYREGISEKKIRFEHALINALRKRGFGLSPDLVKTNYQSSYVKVATKFVEGPQELFAAIYQYLPGEDKYSWNNPLCSTAELSHAAGVLAAYHNIIYGWRDRTGWREPGLIDQIVHMPAQWKAKTDSPGDTVFDRYLIKHIDLLNDSVDRFSNAIGKNVYDTLPHLVIHGDFHPGNLKFQNETVVGLFDFDWSMLDARSFDVGLALIYFCTSWEEGSDGNLLPHRVNLFLDGYQTRAKNLRPLGPLNPNEMQSLPHLMLAGILYITDWTIIEYYNALPDPDEYLCYLKHCVRSIKWLVNNWNQLVYALGSE